MSRAGAVPRGTRGVHYILTNEFACVYVFIIGYKRLHSILLISPAVCCLFIICLSLSVFRLRKTVSVKNGWPAR